ncbi:hypothetical protein [Campylobacter sp. VTCC 70190]|uniref:hypothetical protein n=1 Tax=Campylobacter sp. VTCC 70190 TaxID=3392118 RepID=UPI00398E7F88
MKKAFILIEFISAMMIMSLIFIGIFYYYTQIYKNYENSKLFEKLYKLEESLYEKAILKPLILQTSSLKPMMIQEQVASDEVFEFRKLHFQNQAYKFYFKE